MDWETRILSDEIKLNANAIILNDGDLSNEKEPGINNNKSQKENIETDKQARYNSMYKTNRNYTRIVRKDTRARLDKTNKVYHQKTERLVAMENINMATSSNSYDNKEMKFNVEKPSKE